MDVSLLVCSHNRSASLCRLLDSLSKLDIPLGIHWEVVLVLNACTDDSADIASRFLRRLPMRIVIEPRPGISHARNASVRAARGELLFCTDDDVTVPKDWFVRNLDGFARYRDAAFLGGDILPMFPGADPAWVQAASKAASSAFATFRVGKRDLRLTRKTADRRLPFGANMAFRKAPLSSIEYDSTLGRQPGAVFLGGEESDVFRRLLDNGHIGYLLAANPVNHWIDADRQTAAYIEKFYFGQGWQLGLKDREVYGHDSTWHSAAVRLLAAILSMQLFQSEFWPLIMRLWLVRQAMHFTGRSQSLKAQS